MRCLKCGKECGNENFCSNCGAPLIKEPGNAAPVNVENSNYQPYGNTTPNQNFAAQTSYVPNNHFDQQKNSKNPCGILALILGLVGLFFSCIGFFGLLLDIIAIILGIIGSIKNYKKGTSIAGIVCGIIGVFMFILTIIGTYVNYNTDENSIENTQIISETESVSETESQSADVSSEIESTEKEQETTANSDSQDSEKEFKKSCQKFNYKKIARNPDDYVGQNFKVTVQVYSIFEGGLSSQAYMKAFTDDGSDTYWDHMIYIFDDQDEDSDSYLNVLEDDIITVYGTFEGTEDTTNILNGEKSKDIALHMKYAKLIKE